MSAALALTCVTSGARAASEPIRIEYTAPRTCPDRTALEAQVFPRTSRARPPAPEERARTLVIRIEEDGGEYHGHLVVPATATSARQEREVTSAHCDDLVAALGFFVVLTLEASATTLDAPVKDSTRKEARPAERSRPPERSQSPERSQPPAPPAVAPAGPSVAPADPADPTDPPVTRPREPPAQRTTRDRWILQAGVGPALASGVGPRLLYANRVLVEVGRERPRSLFSPSVAVGAISTATAMADSDRGSIALRMRAFTGLLCPLSVSLGEKLHLRPCALGELGELDGIGVGIVRAQRTGASWATGGLSSRLAIPLGHLILELDAAVVTLLTRPRFTYRAADGAITAFDTPPVGARFGIMLLLRP